jgi:hypothetical protein
VDANISLLTTIRPAYAIGLDLGQAAEHTALAVLEKRWYVDARACKRFPAYSVRHLERFPLGTNYETIATNLRELTSAPPLCWAKLTLDETNVGSAVVKVFHSANLKCRLSAITIAPGHAINSERGLHIPKKELVGTMQVLLQSGRIKVASQLPYAEILKHEIANFRSKPAPPGDDSFESWRERDHDDLVLAVALAAWTAEQMPYPIGAAPFVADFGYLRFGRRRK